MQQEKDKTKAASAKIKFNLPATSKAIKLPKFQPKIRKLRNGNYAEQDILDYRNQIKPLDSTYKSLGNFVLELDLETIWEVIFADQALQPWDRAKGENETKLRRVANWEKPVIEKMMGRKVLAERTTVFESNFKDFLSQTIAAPFFFEMQRSYLTVKAENAIIINQIATGSGFKISKHYDIEHIIEIYQPDPKVNQSVISVQYKNYWPNGAAFYEWPVQNSIE